MVQGCRRCLHFGKKEDDILVQIGLAHARRAAKEGGSQRGML